MLVSAKFPVFEIAIVKVIVSPGPRNPSPLSVVTDADFVTAIFGSGDKLISVGSSSVFPSLSSPSSLVSEVTAP